MATSGPFTLEFTAGEDCSKTAWADAKWTFTSKIKTTRELAAATSTRFREINLHSPGRSLGCKHASLCSRTTISSCAELKVYKLYLIGRCRSREWIQFGRFGGMVMRS